VENDTTSLSDLSGPAVFRSEPESDGNRVVQVTADDSASAWPCGASLCSRKGRSARWQLAADSSYRQRVGGVPGQAQDGDGCARNHAVPGSRFANS